MRKVLIFVASGFSTRMGGFPKGLAEVRGVPVIVNAINNSRDLFDDTIIVANHETRPRFESKIAEYADVVAGAEVREIVTGKGDAESVLKSLLLVRDELGEDFDATFCWGDAYFATPVAFEAMTDPSIDMDEVLSLLVGCSVDEDPYAYLDIRTVEGSFELPLIEKAYFRKKNGPVKVGIHDQCIFRGRAEKVIESLRICQQALGFDGTNYKKSPSGEIGLLNSFSILSEAGMPACAHLFSSGNVLSFNTQEELDVIAAMLQADNPST